MAEARATHPRSDRREADRRFLVGLARAFGGAIFFSMPILMTMEMWWLGFYMDRFRLALLMTGMIPLLIALDHYSGFKRTSTWWEDVMDGITAYGVGIFASVLILLLFDVIDPSMSWDEILGKTAVQSVPASFGAVLAGSQLSGVTDRAEERENEERKETASYREEIFFMLVGAVFLSFSVSPTEEMILIAFKMSHGHAAALAIASLVMMHAFVYAVDFRGSPSAQEGTPWWSLFLRFTTVGYALALVVSAYVLWTFGRLEDHAWIEYVRVTIVLGFPASLGAAAARLIL